MCKTFDSKRNFGPLSTSAHHCPCKPSPEVSPLEDPRSLSTSHLSRTSCLPELPSGFRLTEYQVVVIDINPLQLSCPASVRDALIELRPTIYRVTTHGNGMRHLGNLLSGICRICVPCPHASYPSRTASRENACISLKQPPCLSLGSVTQNWH